MSAIPQPRYTLEQYLARERVAEEKSEFYQGQIFAMAGGSPRHNTISLNTATALKGLLRGSPCRPFSSDQRFRVPANGLSTYPDVAIVCGEQQRDAHDHDALVNPRVIFEVLSPSTENYCRGKKFDLYRELESLREYILITQESAQIERFVRQEDNSWLLTVIKGLTAQLEIATVGCALPLSEIYEDVTFGPDDLPPLSVAR